jgi:endoglucanase
MGNRVKFENGTVGTIGVENYLRRGSDMPSVNDCYIDISEATNEHGLNVNGVVNVGDAAGFWREFEERGNRWIAKSMDDRIGCVVAIETMRQLKQTPSMHEVYFVFTVQEEVGVRGATTSAYGIDPDIGIALDVTPTGDEIKSDKLCNVTLGQGAAIKIRDTGLIVAPQVRDWMTGVAEVKGIPHQREILTGGSTDAKAIHMTRSGVPSGVISVPCRYVHSVSETVDKNDVQACVDLVAALLTQPIEL